MSLTGSGPDDPQRVGVPIGDLLAGMYGAYGVLAALLERRPPAGARSCAPRCSRRSSGCTPSRGRVTPWPARSGGPRATTTRRSARTGSSTARTARSSSASAARGCGAGCARASASTRTPPAWPTNAERVGNRQRVIELVEGAFAGYPTAELLPRLAELGVPSGRVRTLDEVYDWEQTRSQGLVVAVDHPTLGPIDLPGPPLRFFDAAGDETTRRVTPPRRRSASTTRPSAPGSPR